MLLLAGILFLACESTVEPDPSQVGYEYYPLEIGQFRTYDVVEIKFSISNEPDTSIFQLKEVVADTFMDNTGQINYILQRYVREFEEEEWAIDSLWSTYRNDVQAVLAENSIPVIKLVFPIADLKEWDANGLNSWESDKFEMRDLAKPYEVQGLMFPETINIIQEETLDSLISLDFRQEIFALNVGLIEKTDSRLNFCQVETCYAQKIIEEGRIYRQKLSDYGLE